LFFGGFGLVSFEKKVWKLCLAVHWCFFSNLSEFLNDTLYWGTSFSTTTRRRQSPFCPTMATTQLMNAVVIHGKSKYIYMQLALSLQVLAFQ
jgi:hypothetical protein